MDTLSIKRITASPTSCERESDTKPIVYQHIVCHGHVSNPSQGTQTITLIMIWDCVDVNADNFLT